MNAELWLGIAVLVVSMLGAASRIGHRLGRIETTIESWDARAKAAGKAVDDHEQRLRHLEARTV